MTLLGDGRRHLRYFYFLIPHVVSALPGSRFMVFGMSEQIITSIHIGIDRIVLSDVQEGCRAALEGNLWEREN